MELEGTKKPNEMAEAMAGLERHRGEMIRYVILNAELHRAKYEALLAQGFSAAEALELCKILV